MRSAGATRCPLLASALLLSQATGWALAAEPPKWCGKCYQAQDIDKPECHLDPNTFFAATYPPQEQQPILFSCTTRLSAYQTSDLQHGIDVIFDAVSQDPDGSTPLAQSRANAEVKTDQGQILTSQSIDFPTRGSILRIPADKLQNITGDTHLACQLTPDESASKPLSASASLQLLPGSKAGSLVRIDYIEGFLETKASSDSDWAKLLPFGWYTSWTWLKEQGFDKALASMKGAGLTFVHPIPPYDKAQDGDAASITTFTSFLDAAQKAGLGVVYDFRGSYTNLESVKKQVTAFKDHPAIMLWYTADEPDQGDDPKALIDAYQAIKAKDQDNNAHPVALVLNCNDFIFDQYSRGADIIAQDAYPVSVNTTYSRRFNTTCTLTHGDCGCDQCGGYNNLSEASVRTQLFRQRLQIMESAQNSGHRDDVRFAVKSRTPIWAVTQGFGSPGEYWPRRPTVNEFVAMAVGALARSAGGIMPWEWSIAEDIRQEASSQTAAAMGALYKRACDGKGFTRRDDLILDKPAQGVDMGAWQCTDSGGVVMALSNTGYGDGDAYPSNPFQISGFTALDAASPTVLFQTLEGKGSVTFADNVLTGVLAPLQVLVVLIK